MAQTKVGVARRPQGEEQKGFFSESQVPVGTASL